ncbi:pro-neuregulin-2, membrane-bound isoform [Sceloporus undulatus]|uniref:pro-neuregulin-2, membrane-bound isoform n=1 Tax=Sceloporus undulatus TaxID=8520 RepID=UPI001C4C5E70|nr:pro-neuregulin-2, membrane-bound isoform [Sceloporus undulatus]
MSAAPRDPEPTPGGRRTPVPDTPRPLSTMDFVHGTDDTVIPRSPEHQSPSHPGTDDEEDQPRGHEIPDLFFNTQSRRPQPKSNQNQDVYQDLFAEDSRHQPEYVEFFCPPEVLHPEEATLAVDQPNEEELDSVQEAEPGIQVHLRKSECSNKGMPPDRFSYQATEELILKPSDWKRIKGLPKTDSKKSVQAPKASIQISIGCGINNSMSADSSKAVPPKLKKLKSLNAEVGAKISLKCEASAGNPQPSYKWFKDGKELKKSKDIRIKYGNGKKNSRLQFNKVKVEDAGEYSCEAENVLGMDTVRGTLSVRTVSTTLSSGPGHTRQCNETVKSYCVNGGVCYYVEGINQLSCRCPNEFTGDQCQNFAMASFSKHLGLELKEAEELYQKRVLTITGICVALLVVGIVCVVAYCKTKKQRNQMHNHMRQNMCAAHQNRNLANGPSHPRLDPEEIQMADYMSKNVPATEHVIRREAETTFSGSHSCSPSHPCSTGTPTSSQRHESHTWSLERTESLTSDCQSGIMLSSVGTSKCNSPACVEARARREAAYSLEEQRRPMMQYRDSVDSLRDSPHSERYVSALTTPARLSPVDLHYSASTHMPTFEITSPNSAHAVSLPPAASISFQVEEQQPLLRRYQVPFQDIQRYDSYYQRRSYLNESTGSLPSSPFRITEDDEYETTHEYITALEHPKRTGHNNRRWRKSKLNGHLSHRGKMLRDSFSVSSASYSESDEELVAESTPFLSMRNAEAMDPDSPPLYRLADSRTYYSFDRCSTQGDNRLTRTRPNQDSAPP